MVKDFNLKVAEKEPTFKVGDWVMVNAKNIKTRCPMKKLDYKLHKKFRIKRLIGMNAYESELSPSTGKIHTVFHKFVRTLPPEQYTRQAVTGPLLSLYA